MTSPIDAEGYPTQEALDMITNWEIKKRSDYHTLMAFVKSMWAYAPMAFRKYRERYTLITLGWSGNENIIGALHDNFVFKAVCWESSQRGGRHCYEPMGFKFQDEAINE